MRLNMQRVAPRLAHLAGAIAVGVLLLAASAALAGGNVTTKESPTVQTSADAVLTSRLDSTLRPVAAAGRAATVEVMVFVRHGSGAPQQLLDPVRIKLAADNDTDIWVGKVSGTDMTKLATASDVRYIEDNRAIDPPWLPDTPSLDTPQTRAAAAKASANIAAANAAGIPKRWIKSFDKQGNLVSPASRSDSRTHASRLPASGGLAPTGWMDVRSTHRSSTAWAEGYTGKGVLVGVADTGVDFAHPDLQGTQATVTAPTSPYYGWPMAYDPHSLTDYASDAQHDTTNVASGTTWFSDTSHIVNRSGSSFATFDGVLYTLPNASLSGRFHIGYLNDDKQLGEVMTGFAAGKAPILVTDEHTAGVYDTVRVDLNANEDFTDDKPCTKASPISYLDYWNSQSATLGPDGYADVSGGMVYWISDGTHQPPGYDVTFTGGSKPGAGNLVCFMGSLDWFENHGTLCASNIVGQGRTNGSSVASEYPSFKGAGTGGMVQGGGKNARLVGIGNIYKSASTNMMAYDFAARGLDATANSGDELQVLSCSYGDSETDNDEWDYESRYMTKLNTTIAPHTTFVVSTGNGGPGYGTNTPPTPSTGIKVGASTQFGACGGWDSIVGTDQITVGDVIGWSNRGPSAMGRMGVDVVADGAFSSGATPLNNAFFTDHADGWRAWEIWGGTSRSTPVVAGDLTLVYQAFKAKNGHWPTWSEARTLMMNGAKDLSYDPLVQGAGMLDAARSVDLAAGLRGLKIAPSAWVAGDFRGVTREGFSNIMHAGDTDSTTFKVRNQGAKKTHITARDVWHQRAWTTSLTVTLDPAQQSAINFNRPDKLIDITSMIPANTDLLVVRTVYPLSEMDPTSSFDTSTATKNDIRLLAYDWKDVNADGKLWTDSNGNGFVNDGEIEHGEYMRFTYGYGRATSHEIRVQHPRQRMHSGVFLGLQTRYHQTGVVHVKVQLSGWNRVNWPWLSLSTSGLTLRAHATAGISAKLAVPAKARPGIYEGQILVTDPTHTTAVPVSVNVAGPGATMTFGGTSPYETLMDNTRVFGQQDWTYRAESGDWRFYMADVADKPALPARARWLVHTTWDAPPTDIDTLLYGPAPRSSTWPTGSKAFFGPYDLTYKGGSANTNSTAGIWTFDTVTGGAQEWVSGPLSTGLNEIMIHNTLYSGKSIGSAFTGAAGVIASEPGTVTVRSAATSGSVPVKFSTSMNLPGLATAVAGLSEVKRYTDQISEGQHWFKTLTVANAPYIHVTCACDSADIDLYLQHWNGSKWVVVGKSTSSSGNEDIKLLRPEAGDYAIEVNGYHVPTPKTPFTVTWDAPEGSSLTLRNAPVGALHAGSAYTMALDWTRPGVAPYPEDNLYHGVVYLGVPGDPRIIEIPVEFVAESVAATATGSHTSSLTVK